MAKKINVPQEDVSGKTKLENKEVTENLGKDILEDLNKEKLENPFPNHKGYTAVRDKLTPEAKKKMKENIKVTADGKIEMIGMRKKFSILTAKSDGKNILINPAMPGVTYFTGKAAEEECEKQGKKLLKNKKELDNFINIFPGENIKQKIYNLAQLFGLEKAGCWHPIKNNERFYNVGSMGRVTLSVGAQHEGSNVCDPSWDVNWNDDDAFIGWYFNFTPQPVVACEDC